MRVMHVLSQLSYASTAYITTFLQKFNTVFPIFYGRMMRETAGKRFVLLFWSHDSQLIVIASTALFSHDLCAIPGLAAFIGLILQGLCILSPAFRRAWHKALIFNGFYGNIRHI